MNDSGQLGQPEHNAFEYKTSPTSDTAPFLSPPRHSYHRRLFFPPLIDPRDAAIAVAIQSPAVATTSPDTSPTQYMASSFEKSVKGGTKIKVLLL